MSSYDAAEVKRLMKAKLIFPDLLHEESRSQILNSILTLNCMIPSLHTFFEDQKYIEPCCAILKTLLGDCLKDESLWLGFSANFWEPETVRAHQKEIGYLQLWMFCLRNYPEMISIKPKLALKRGKKRRWEQKPALWKNLGNLAVQLGFRTGEAIRLAENDADREHAQRFIETARPGCPDLESAINEVMQVLEKREHDTQRPIHPVFTDSQLLHHDRRCGRDHDDDFDNDRLALFESIFSIDSGSGHDITSMFVKRNVIERFLGRYTSIV